MAPAPAPAVSLRAIAIVVAIIAAVAWALTSQPQRPQPVKVEPVTVTPVQPPPAAAALPPAADTSPLFACTADAYKTRGGLVVCGVVAVDQQYVWVQQGWIAAVGNFSASFTLYGDTSQCQFQLTGNRLSVSCKAPIAVRR